VRKQATTTISGTVPPGTYVIQVFVNPSCADPEGKRFLGTPASSSGTWTLSVPALVAGQGVTATAINLSTLNTSQFSTCKAT